MKNIKRFYFAGSSHIDPVWMWRWTEGFAEAKATLRSALDRMKEYPEFIFVSGTSVIFEWIEECDPEMFEEIRQRIKEGRFAIVNGWYVQPDCNLPSGEGFARQSLYGQRYFFEKFGVTAKTGYNVDSFGHNFQIPQFLVKSGMDSYVAHRPGKHEKELPNHVFRWRAPDGSEVIFSRQLRVYHTTAMHTMPFTMETVYTDGPESLKEMLTAVDDAVEPGEMDTTLFLYGVGNHGGGPTKKTIESILTLREQMPDTEFVMSDTRDFFAEMYRRKAELPVVQDDMQHHAAGCYSAVSAIKTGVRRAEWDLFSAENYTMLAKGLLDKKIPAPAEFEKAWKNVLFAHFHDCMGGCSEERTYEDSDTFLKESRAMAQRTQANMLQTISWKIDTSDAEKGIPVVLFNPHCFDVETVVTVSRRIEVLYDSEGNEVPSQIVRNPDSRCRKRPGDTVFKAKIPALGYATYYYHGEIPEPGHTPYYYRDMAAEKPVYTSDLSAGELTMENAFLRVTFEKRTGWISSIYDKENDRELLRGKGAVPVVIDEFGCDTWAHRVTFFDREIARFHDATITLLEEGPIRTRIKVSSRYNESTLDQYFSLYPESKEMDVECRLDWHEGNKMLKLRYETIFDEDPAAFYEIPCGVIQRPADGEEEPGQSWIAVMQENDGMALMNDCKYSYSVKGGDLNLTVCRSPYYIDHGRGNQNDPESRHTDQGEQFFRYGVMLMKDVGFGALTQAARLMNQQPTVIVENNHKGILGDTARGLGCEADNVIITACKQSEDGKGMVIRAYETEGRQTEVTFTGAALPAPLTATFKPWSIQTYYLENGSKEWKEVMLTEFDYPEEGF